MCLSENEEEEIIHPTLPSRRGTTVAVRRISLKEAQQGITFRNLDSNKIYRDFIYIDDVINEPLIGAHRQKDEAIKALGDYFLDSLKELKKLTPAQRHQLKYEKLMNLGRFEEDSK